MAVVVVVEGRGLVVVDGVDEEDVGTVVTTTPEVDTTAGVGVGV